VVTADHGNAEVMINDNGGPLTSHTTNPVPLIIAGGDYKLADGVEGALCDIAPTCLAMMVGESHFADRLLLIRDFAGSAPAGGDDRKVAPQIGYTRLP
jgi:hypothetical protein